MIQKKPNIKARLKAHLLRDKGITHNQAQKMFGTNRLAAYVYRIKNEMRELGLEVFCTIVSHDGHQYGIYNTRKIRK